MPASVLPQGGGRLYRTDNTRKYDSRWKNDKGRIRQAPQSAHCELACRAAQLQAQQRLRHIQPQGRRHGLAHSPDTHTTARLLQRNIRRDRERILTAPRNLSKVRTICRRPGRSHHRAFDIKKRECRSALGMRFRHSLPFCLFTVSFSRAMRRVVRCRVSCGCRPVWRSCSP